MSKKDADGESRVSRQIAQYGDDAPGSRSDDYEIIMIRRSPEQRD